MYNINSHSSHHKRDHQNPHYTYFDQEVASSIHELKMGFQTGHFAISNILIYIHFLFFSVSL